jgi:hypothetical protein
VITTIYGDMDEKTLEPRWGVLDNDHEHTTWIEYYLRGELVHRSVHVTLKQGVAVPVTSGNLS